MSSQPEEFTEDAPVDEMDNDATPFPGANPPEED